MMLGAAAAASSETQQAYAGHWGEMDRRGEQSTWDGVFDVYLSSELVARLREQRRVGENWQ